MHKRFETIYSTGESSLNLSEKASFIHLCSSCAVPFGLRDDEIHDFVEAAGAPLNFALAVSRRCPPQESPDERARFFPFIMFFERRAKKTQQPLNHFVRR